MTAIERFTQKINEAKQTITMQNAGTEAALNLGQNYAFQHQNDPVLGNLPYAGPVCSDPIRAASVYAKRIRTADMLAQARAIQAIKPSVMDATNIANAWVATYKSICNKSVSKRQCRLGRARAVLTRRPIDLLKLYNNHWDAPILSICEQAAEAEFQSAQALLEKINVQVKLIESDYVAAQTERIQTGKSAVSPTSPSSEKQTNYLYLGIGLLVASALLFYMIKKRK